MLIGMHTMSHCSLDGRAVLSDKISIMHGDVLTTELLLAGSEAFAFACMLSSLFKFEALHACYHR